MKVRKSDSTKKPGYPTKRQFLAALGLGALTVGTQGCLFRPAGKMATEPRHQNIESVPLGGDIMVDPGPEAPVADTNTVSYTVKKGDTLYSMAKNQLGNGQRWRDIITLNPGLDPAALKIGSTLLIPTAPK